MKKVFLLLILIIGGAAGYYWHISQVKTPSSTIKLYGNVDIRQVDISFQVGGVVNDMLFEEGEHVSKGDLLARLDDKDYVENYLKSVAEIKRLEAVSREAQSVVDTQKPLCEKGFTSKRNCDSYANARDEALAIMEAAIVLNRYEQNQLNYTKVYAPDDGIITSRIQEPGATVKSGQIIYTIAKSKPIWIRAYIPETNLGDITYGTKAKVTTDTMDKKTGRKQEYVGRVGYISPVAEFTPKAVQSEDLRTDLVYRINVYVDEPDEFLKQGMPTTIEIGEEHQSDERVLH